MITLDTVMLLQQKVEEAVGKIRLLSGEVSQLQAERDALTNERDALRGELNGMKEQLGSLMQNQSQIENSILQSIDRLGCISNQDVAPQADVQQGGYEPNTLGQMSESQAPVDGHEQDNNGNWPLDGNQWLQSGGQSQGEGQQQGGGGNPQEVQPQGENGQWQEGQDSAPQGDGQWQGDSGSYQSGAPQDEQQAADDPNQGGFDIF